MRKTKLSVPNSDSIISDIKSWHADQRLSKELLVSALQKIPSSELNSDLLKSRLYKICLDNFGSIKNTFESIGKKYEETLTHVPWTREKLVNIIRYYYNKGVPIDYQFISDNHNCLIYNAEEIFGSWSDAIEASGINCDNLKCSYENKIYKSKDGNNYYSRLEFDIANSLLELKDDNLILDYKHQVSVTTSKNWFCDFKILFNTGFELLLEVDCINSGKHGGAYTDNHPKIKFYKKYRYPYEIIHSVPELFNIVKKYSKLYYIPLEKSIITAHKNPDGDAISSCVAVYNYLKLNGVKSVIKLDGIVPFNLVWMFDNVNKNDIDLKDISEFKQIIVLDSDCSKERLGWELPDLPTINIDHHATGRLDDHNPEKGVYVINACSNAVVLFRWFGIKDNILAVGAYTDTYFSKNINEVLYFLSDLNISDDEIEEILEKVSFRSDRRTWHIIRDSKVHNCKNGFIIVETNEEDLTSIENAMSILMKMKECVCLIYGKEKNVKLRTSNKALDLSKIAKKFGGGGHNFACMCSVKNRISEFKDDIIHFEK